MNATWYGASLTASTASSPLATASTRQPSFSSICLTTTWLTLLSSATRTRNPAPSAVAADGSAVGVTMARAAASASAGAASAASSTDGGQGLTSTAAIPTAVASS